ncbi:LOW QUALITY PROTEIN: elongation factor 1-gamma [Colletotrichum tofieldiae]|nr:LOW QUALITY PROTEIN: elongation factor 1-gamma [Colletotrichum tofieldiae]
MFGKHHGEHQTNETPQSPPRTRRPPFSVRPSRSKCNRRFLNNPKERETNVSFFQLRFHSEVDVFLQLRGPPPMGAWYRPLLGKDTYNKKAVEDSSKVALKAVKVVEEHLLSNTYLVGERITLADLFAAGIIARGFEFFFDKQWRQENPSVTRWYDTIINQDIWTAVAEKQEYLETPKLTNPKKEAAPKAAKAAAPAAEEAAPAPKPKHPLAELPAPRSTLRSGSYSNIKDHDEAMKWFWDNVNFEEFSLWKVKYKYNDELTMTFMSNNLIGGFNNRLEASRKFIFGCAAVYGQNNDSVIEGAFVIRGQDYKPAFDVAPDYESYEFEKLDPPSPRTASSSLTPGAGRSLPPTTARSTPLPMARSSNKRIALGSDPTFMAYGRDETSLRLGKGSVEVVVDLGHHVARLVCVAKEFGDLEEVVRLAARLLERVVDEHGVGLVPAAAVCGVRVRRLHVLLTPDHIQALVDLHAQLVVGVRQAEAVAAPDGEDAAAVRAPVGLATAARAAAGGAQEELVAHGLDVARTGRGPDDDMEGVEAVLQEAPGVGPLDEGGCLAAVRAVEEGAVEVHDDEDGARGGEEGRRDVSAAEVIGGRIGDTAGRGTGGLDLIAAV